MKGKEGGDFGGRVEADKVCVLVKEERVWDKGSQWANVTIKHKASLY